MIYHIKQVENDSYEISSRLDKPVIISKDFLSLNLPKNKLEELYKTLSISFRGILDLSSFYKETDLEEPELKTETNSSKDKVFYQDGLYLAKESLCYPGVRELWRLSNKGYYRFVVYFFNKELAKSLIEEHKAYLNYNKRFRRDSYLDSFEQKSEYYNKDDDTI